MREQDILIIGGGIGGLTAAIALRAGGHRVTVIERDPEWSVYGVGIIQQGNVLRAMAQLGLLDDYLSLAVGFDFVAVHAPDGTLGRSLKCAVKAEADWPDARIGGSATGQRR